jgi:hypothetical protein
MTWSVPIEISQKKPGSSRLFEPVSQSQKNGKTQVASCAGLASVGAARQVEGFLSVAN